MKKIGHHVSTAGLLFGTFFFALSLTPSLLPRTDTVQGLISGASATAGYALGVLAVWVWTWLELPRPRERIQHLLHFVAAVICGVLAISFLWQASEWQNDIHALMGMEQEVAGVRAVLVGAIALLVFLAAVLSGKLIRQSFRRLFLLLSERLRRVVPHRLSVALSLVGAFLLFWAVIDGVMIAVALRGADAFYQRIDSLMDPEQERPTDPMKTGSAASLINWEDLGRAGRRYVTDGPTAAEIEAFTGTPALPPLRVYVGLNAAETPEQRAELALRELQRVGGFDRSMLVLIAPTGTGWVDPAATGPLEYLQRGDIASVAAQYSYLPSPISLMAEGAYGAESSRALFQAIYGHWRELPEARRPSLYLFGLSLGALNSDRSFDFYDIIDDPFDGALWSGPPFRTETWRTATQRRRPGSPAWLPRFRDDSVIRFANQYGGLETGREPWGDFRIAFLQYASDPVTFFSPESFYREPDWMKPPRGPDVSDNLRWFPIVTGLQLFADMTLGSAPTGYGHQYAAEDYLDSWYALTEPEDWSTRELEQLAEVVAQRFNR